MGSCKAGPPFKTAIGNAVMFCWTAVVRRRYGDPQLRVSGLRGKWSHGGGSQVTDGHTGGKLSKRKARGGVLFQLFQSFLNDGAGLSHIVLMG